MQDTHLLYHNDALLAGPSSMGSIWRQRPATPSRQPALHHASINPSPAPRLHQPHPVNQPCTTPPSTPALHHASINPIPSTSPAPDLHQYTSRWYCTVLWQSQSHNHNGTCHYRQYNLMDSHYCPYAASRHPKK